VQTSKLVEDLKAYDFSSSLNVTREEDIGASTDVRHGLAGSVGGSVVAIGTMLENAMEELFIPYNEGAKYIDKECKTIADLYGAYLDRYIKYHVSFQNFARFIFLVS
jgi:hypothetical protein